MVLTTPGRWLRVVVEYRRDPRTGGVWGMLVTVFEHRRMQCINSDCYPWFRLAASQIGYPALRADDAGSGPAPCRAGAAADLHCAEVSGDRRQRRPRQLQTAQPGDADAAAETGTDTPI